MPAVSNATRSALTGTEPLSERDAALLRAAGARRMALLLDLGAGPEMRLLHPEQAIVIGRRPAQGWGVAGKKLSREHARFSLSRGRVLVEDLGSTNGTFVNSEQITQAVRLGKGDLLQIGSTVFEVSR